MLKRQLQMRSRVGLILATVVALVLNLLPNAVPGLPTPTASAHNLDASVVYAYFDTDTQAMLDARINSPGWTPPTPMLQVGDELGIIIKGVPDNGTTTGVGGYTTFYIPNGVQVLDAAFLMPGSDPSDGITGYDRVPAKGQAQMPAVGAGGGPTANLVGITRGPNILGVTSPIVGPGNLNLGTLPGVYGDTGIFYSTVPETAYGTYTGGTLTNNSGDTVGIRTLLGTPLNKWDAWQMQAYGIAGTSNPAYSGSPIIDSNGRGYAPWGLANVVAGPQSGYAWEFDKDKYDACDPLPYAPSKNCIDQATQDIGPWQRIKYPGSQFADDPPGANPAVQPYTRGSDASKSGFDLTTGDLPPTTGQANGSPNAIRFAFGQLTINTPEFAWVKVKVNNTSAILDNTGCPYWNVDTFGGDAGGDSGGKDHIWRYYDPNSVRFSGCLAVGKPATKDVVKVGDTFQYKIKVYNMGGVALSNVVMRDILPSGTTFISAVPAQSSGPNPLAWNVGALLPGQKFEAVVTVKAAGSGILNNTLTATGNPPSGPAITTTATEKVVAGSVPVLNQSKSVTPSSIAPGGNVQYTVRIENVGSGPSGNPIVITEYLPTGFTYISKDSVLVNGANMTAATTVNATNPNQPIFTVPAAVNAGQVLLLTFTAKAGATVTAGAYCNSYKSTQAGINLVTGALACVNVGGASIGDTVYRDWNGNGTQDAGEEGIAGLQVCATPTGGGAPICATTDANGNYLINGLTAGSYNVAVTNPPAGYTPRQTVANPLTLNDGAKISTADFGYQPGGAGIIGDKVFEDLANDGLFNGADVGVDGVTVTLYEDTNGNGVLDAGQDVQVATTTTAGGGSYSFTNLDPTRSYLVVATDGAGSTVDTYFANAYVSSTGAPQKVSPADFTAQSNNVTDADLGYFGQTPGSIGDTVCIDTNRNGLCDGGEQGIANVTINLYNDLNNNGVADPGEPVINTMTSITGSYQVNGLGPGHYLVVVDQTDPDIPDGYVPSVSQYSVNLAVAQAYLTADFPFIQVLTKTVDKATAVPGDTLNYTIIAAYPGPELLADVTISDTIPAGATYVANSANAGGVYSTTTNAVEWALGSNTDPIPGLTAATGSALCPVVTTLNPVADTFIDFGNPTKNNGGNTLLITRPANASSLKYTLLRFNTSSIPSGAVIQSAMLGINVQSARSSNHFDKIYRMKTDWAEGTGSNTTCTSASNGATWNAPNCTDNWAGGAFSSLDYDSTLLGTIAPKTKGYKTANVVNAVDGWINQGVANRGLVLVSTGTDGGDGKYYNREDTAVNTDPYLKVTYLVETVGGCSGPTSLEAVADTYVDLNSPTNNFGGDTTMLTRPADSTRYKHSLLQFDLTSIPPDATITSATLAVTVQSQRSSNHSDEVRQLLTPWTEFEATWSDANGATTGDWQTSGAFGSSDYGTTVYGTIQPVGNDTTHTANITTLVQNWVNNGVPNNGLVLLSTGTDGGDAKYYTHEASGADAGFRPKLTVNWTLPPNPGGQTKVTLSTTPLLPGQAGQVQVTLVVTATSAVADIMPPVNLNVTASGATVTKVSGPTPSGPVSIPAGGATTFTYIYNVTPGSLPGLITFSGKPTSASAQFATGFSPGVIVSPPFTFQVTVNNPAGVPYIQNSAVIADAGPLAERVTAPPAITSLSASIGDRVWADLDGDGVQDPGEPGLNGVQVCATPTGGGVAVCATTDALGNYHIYGLTNNASYNVALTLAMLPVNYQPTTPTTLTRTATTAGVTDADFGLRPPGTASIGDTVWLDANEDGVVDSGESGLSNVTVRLYIDQNNDGVIDGSDTLIQTAATDANGLYQFTGLHPDDYLVQVVATSVVTTPYGVATTLGAAMDPTTGTSNPRDVTITTAGQAITNADFGYNWGGSIGDYLWYDLNGDQIQNNSAGEAGAVTTAVLYYDSNGNGKADGGEPIVAIADSTPGTGLYLFDNLPPGNYVVAAEEQQVPAPPSSPNAGQIGTMVATTGSRHAVALAPNQDYTTADFGFIEAAEVEGYVFHDVDHGGVKDSSDPGLPNIAVTLSGTDNNGNPVSLTTTTDAAGEYSFIVPPGDYTITYNTADPDMPAGLTEATTPTSLQVTVSGGQEVSGLDFGVDNMGKIGDRVWLDANGNGLQDVGEPGLMGVTVNLYDSTGTTLLATTVTTATGGYLFPGLADGAYVAKVDNSTVLGGTTTQTGDPDASKDNQGTATVSGGGSVLTMDFGYQPPGTLYTISGRVYNDANNDSNDNSEPGFANVDVAVLCDTGLFTTKTDATGAWSISGIKAGSVCTVLDADETDLPRNAYALTETPASITVNSNLTGLDFGYNLRPGSISGTVVVGDGDGLAEVGEAPIQGVTITLRYAGVDGILNTTDDVLTTQLTNASGDYSFTNLDAGLYQIVETNLPTYGSLADADGGNPDNISLNLALGQTKTDQDFEDQATVAPRYTIQKTRLTPDPVRVGDDITFTIRILNIGTVAIDVLPLRDLYATADLLFVSASQVPVDYLNDGQLDWNDLTVSFGRDLAPGDSFVVTTVFVARHDTTALSGGATINTAVSPISPTLTTTAPVRIEAPTNVQLASTSASLAGQQANLAWTTVSEATVVGFHVLRREVGTGGWVRINPQLIPAQQAGQASGASYTFTDPQIELGRTYLYMLEIIENGGQATRVELGVIGAGNRLLLPVVLR